MSDVATAILDAALKHIRVGGFSAFSHRNLAEEVGVKSSSVHYHFPTKDRLAAAVIHRYTADVAEYADSLFAKESDPVKVLAEAFREPVVMEERLCPCVTLGAELNDLPPETVIEVKGYYRMWLDKLVEKGVTKAAATAYISSLLGAQLLASIFHDVAMYDAVAEKLLRDHAAVAA